MILIQCRDEFLLYLGMGHQFFNVNFVIWTEWFRNIYKIIVLMFRIDHYNIKSVNLMVIFFLDMKGLIFWNVLLRFQSELKRTIFWNKDSIFWNKDLKLRTDYYADSFALVFFGILLLNLGESIIIHYYYRQKSCFFLSFLYYATKVTIVFPFDEL